MIVALVFEILLFGGFAALSKAWPDRADQPLLRKDLIDDAIYFLGGALIYGQLFAWLRSHGGDLGWIGVAGTGARRLQAWTSARPLGLQLLAFLLLYDLAQYGLHRAFHGRDLWRWHSVHHSPQEIDVMTSYRWHPVNVLAYVGLPTLLVAMIGFSPAVFGLAGLFNAVMSALTHANLRWSFGPFRYVLASPMFHRWHHARFAKGWSCNYAPNFPVWDLMFGTFHMPEGERPAAYGLPTAPPHFAQQMAYPFRRPKTLSSAGA